MNDKFTQKNINKLLLGQKFSSFALEDELENLKSSLREFVKIDNCVAVLSDFKDDRSFVFAGSFASFFGISNLEQNIDSAFEDFIFEKIHPADLELRHKLEVQYIDLQLSLPFSKRIEYNTECRIRVQNQEKEYQYIMHQMRYPRSLPDGTIWLAVCLYYPAMNQSLTGGIDGVIYNNTTGKVVNFDNTVEPEQSSISARELEVLTLISQGLLSKNIAFHLQISVNTVHRHRQNIISKMKVSNVAEAVSKAKLMGILANR